MRYLALILVALALSACVAIPYPPLNNIDREGLKAFEVGTTKKHAVIDALDDPIADFDDGRVLLFQGTYSKFGLFFAAGIGGPYGGVGVVDAGDVPDERYNILVRFDQQDRIESWEVIKTTAADDWAVAPPSKTTPLIEEILFPNAAFGWVEYSQDGSTIAVSRASEDGPSRTYKDIVIWKQDLEQPPTVVNEPAATFALSYNGGIIYVPRTEFPGLFKAMEYSIGIWDVLTNTMLRSIGKPKQPWYLTQGGMQRLSVSPNGKHLAGKDFNQLVVWNSGSGERIALSDETHRFYVASMAFSPDSQRLAIAGSITQYFELWDFKSEEPPSGPGNKNYPEVICTSVAFSPDGKQLAINCHSHIQIWQLNSSSLHSKADQLTFRRIILMPSYSYATSDHFFRSAIEYSADGDTLVALHGAIVAFDLITAKEVWRIEPSSENLKTSRIYDFALRPDGRAIAVTRGNGLYVYDLEAVEPKPQ